MARRRAGRSCPRKLTLGARFTDDRKTELDRIGFLSGLVPLGTTDEDAAMAALVAQGQADFDASTLGAQVFEAPKGSYDKITGRAAVNYAP